MANPIATFETTEGTFTVELFRDRAPRTVGNFVELASDDFYDGLIFHRVIQDFMIQGGDPEGTGMGGPGYTIDDEFHPELRHDAPGILSMANAGPDTGGSQFFITLAATPWLDDRHAVFGRVASGMDVVEEIGSVQTDANDRPVDDVRITAVSIEDAD
ncbi:MAG: peptidylprolyl isomerase [Longimicrobiales bacterium]